MVTHGGWLIYQKPHISNARSLEICVQLHGMPCRRTRCDFKASTTGCPANPDGVKITWSSLHLGSFVVSDKKTLYNYHTNHMICILNISTYFAFTCIKKRKETLWPCVLLGVCELDISTTDIVKQRLKAFLPHSLQVSTFLPYSFLDVLGWSSIFFSNVRVEVRVIGPHMESQL